MSETEIIPEVPRENEAETAKRKIAADRQVAAAPILYQGQMRKAYDGVSSPRSAIKAYCLSCTHYDRAEISNCSVLSCPLWSYRPYQQAKVKV